MRNPLILPRHSTSTLFRQRGLNLIELMFVAFIISLLAIVALPVYQDYTIRAKVAGGIGFIPPVKLRVMEYFISNGTLPTLYTQLGLDPTAYDGDLVLEKIDLVNVPRPGTIELTFSSLEIPALGANNIILYEPIPKHGTLRWDCTGGDVIARFRPSQCRPEVE
ncbi:MAG: type IV pilus assembly protein PilA [Halieaceae bacterium]|jgi:type IV pilus assembly protein PilA